MSRHADFFLRAAFLMPCRAFMPAMPDTESLMLFDAMIILTLPFSATMPADIAVSPPRYFMI